MDKEEILFILGRMRKSKDLPKLIETISLNEFVINEFKNEIVSGKQTFSEKLKRKFQGLD